MARQTRTSAEIMAVDNDIDRFFLPFDASLDVGEFTVYGTSDPAIDLSMVNVRHLKAYTQFRGIWESAPSDDPQAIGYTIGDMVVGSNNVIYRRADMNNATNPDPTNTTDNTGEWVALGILIDTTLNTDMGTPGLLRNGATVSFRGYRMGTGINIVDNVISATGVSLSDIHSYSTTANWLAGLSMDSTGTAVAWHRGDVAIVTGGDERGTYVYINDTPKTGATFYNTQGQTDDWVILELPANVVTTITDGGSNTFRGNVTAAQIAQILNNRLSLENLSNVSDTAPTAAGQHLVTVSDGAGGFTWQPGNANITTESLEDLTNTTITSPTVGQALKISEVSATGVATWTNQDDEGIPSFTRSTNLPSTEGRAGDLTVTAGQAVDLQDISQRVALRDIGDMDIATAGEGHLIHRVGNEWNNIPPNGTDGLSSQLNFDELANTNVVGSVRYDVLTKSDSDDWINTTPANVAAGNGTDPATGIQVGNLSDTAYNNLQSNDLLTREGTEWVNITRNDIFGRQELNTLQNVTYTSDAAEQITHNPLMDAGGTVVEIASGNTLAPGYQWNGASATIDASALAVGDTVFFSTSMAPPLDITASDVEGPFTVSAVSTAGRFFTVPLTGPNSMTVEQRRIINEGVYYAWHQVTSRIPQRAGDVLAWNGTTWINTPASATTVAMVDLNDLRDVTYDDDVENILYTAALRSSDRQAAVGVSFGTISNNRVTLFAGRNATGDFESGDFTVGDIIAFDPRTPPLTSTPALGEFEVVDVTAAGNPILQVGSGTNDISSTEVTQVNNATDYHVYFIISALRGIVRPGDVLVRSADGQNWVNETAAQMASNPNGGIRVEELRNVELASLASDQSRNGRVLTFEDGQWIDREAGESQLGTAALDDIGDVDAYPVRFFYENRGVATTVSSSAAVTFTSTTLATGRDNIYFTPNTGFITFGTTTVQTQATFNGLTTAGPFNVVQVIGNPLQYNVYRAGQLSYGTGDQAAIQSEIQAVIDASANDQIIATDRQQRQEGPELNHSLLRWTQTNPVTGDGSWGYVEANDLINGRIADWAEQGNTDDIPASKLDQVEDWALTTNSASQVQRNKLGNVGVFDWRSGDDYVANMLVSDNGQIWRALRRIVNSTTAPSEGADWTHLVDVDVADWAEQDNTDNIPDNKLGNVETWAHTGSTDQVESGKLGNVAILNNAGTPELQTGITDAEVRDVINAGEVDSVTYASGNITVTNQDATTNQISSADILGGGTLDDIGGVTLGTGANAPATGQHLVFQNGQWTNHDGSETSIELDDLGDVTITEDQREVLTRTVSDPVISVTGVSGNGDPDFDIRFGAAHGLSVNDLISFQIPASGPTPAIDREQVFEVNTVTDNFQVQVHNRDGSDTASAFISGLDGDTLVTIATSMVSDPIPTGELIVSHRIDADTLGWRNQTASEAGLVTGISLGEDDPLDPAPRATVTNGEANIPDATSVVGGLINAEQYGKLEQYPNRPFTIDGMERNLTGSNVIPENGMAEFGLQVERTGAGEQDVVTRWVPIADVMNQNNLIFDDTTTANQATLSQYRTNANVLETVRSASTASGNLVLTLASFNPMLGVRQAIISRQWDQPFVNATTGLGVTTTSPDDFPSRYVDEVSAITVDGTRNSGLSLSNFVAGARTRTPGAGVDWDQNFTLNTSSELLAPGTTGLSGGSAVVTYTFEDNNDANIGTRTQNINWATPNVTTGFDAYPQRYWWERVVSNTLDTNITGISTGANVSTAWTQTGTVTGTLPTTATGIDHNNQTITFSTPLYRGINSPGSITATSTFTRPDSVVGSGNSYTATATAIATVAVPNFEVPNLRIWVPNQDALTVSSFLSGDFNTGNGLDFATANGQSTASIPPQYDIPQAQTTFTGANRFYWFGFTGAQSSIRFTDLATNLEIAQETSQTVTFNATTLNADSGISNVPSNLTEITYHFYGILLNAGTNRVRINL